MWVVGTSGCPERDASGDLGTTDFQPSAPGDSGKEDHDTGGCENDPTVPPFVDWSESQVRLQDEYAEERCGHPRLQVTTRRDGWLFLAEGWLCDEAGREIAATGAFHRGDGGSLAEYVVEGASTSLTLGTSFSLSANESALAYVHSRSSVSGIPGIWVVDTQTALQVWSIEQGADHPVQDVDVRLAKTTDRSLVLSTIRGPDERGELWVYDALPPGTYEMGDVTAFHSGLQADDDLGAYYWDLGDVNGDGLHDLGVAIRHAIYMLEGDDLLVDQGVVNATLAWSDLASAGETAVTGLGDLDRDGYLEWGVVRAGTGDTQGGLVILDSMSSQIASVNADHSVMEELSAAYVGDLNADSSPEALLFGRLGDAPDSYFLATLPTCGALDLIDVAEPLGFPTDGVERRVDAAAGGFLLQPVYPADADVPTYVYGVDQRDPE